MTPREESARNRQARSARLDESASESSSGGSSYYTSDEEDERGGYAHPQPAPEPLYTDTRPLTPRSVHVPVPSALHAAACTETNHPHRHARSPRAPWTLTKTSCSPWRTNSKTFPSKALTWTRGA